MEKEITVHIDNIEMYTSYKSNGKLLEWDTFNIVDTQDNLAFIIFDLNT